MKSCSGKSEDHQSYHSSSWGECEHLYDISLSQLDTQEVVRQILQFIIMRLIIINNNIIKMVKRMSAVKQRNHPASSKVNEVSFWTMSHCSDGEWSRPDLIRENLVLQLCSPNGGETFWLPNREFNKTPSDSGSEPREEEGVDMWRRAGVCD